jgi:hypothetical protein
LGFCDPRVSLGLADHIAALEGDISGFISMKFHKEIDDDLFEAMVEKVIIRSQTGFEFYFESGQVINLKAGD